MELLLLAGANVHARDSTGHTPLCAAETLLVVSDGNDTSREEIYASLIEAGVIPEDCRTCSESKGDQPSWVRRPLADTEIESEEDEMSFAESTDDDEISDDSSV